MRFMVSRCAATAYLPSLVSAYPTREHRERAVPGEFPPISCELSALGRIHGTDEARRAAAVAQAQASSAGAQVQANADAGTDVVQAKAQRDVARAGTQAAQARLAQATLRAPADARVLLRAVEPGQIVQPGKALLSLALAGPTQLVAQVDERFLEQ